jgi:hypothetical protein
MPAGVNPPQWISIADGTPDKGQTVCYYSPYVGWWVGKYHGKGRHGHQWSSFGGFLSDDVTHWFPMPERPSRRVRLAVRSRTSPDSKRA